jgi:hypothetical protein
MKTMEFDDIFTCIPQMTTLSAVFICPSRVRHAHAHGLSCAREAYQHAAGLYADVARLEAAHALGMRYTATVMNAAACYNDLAVVQFLRAQGCGWSFGMFNIAAGRGSIAMCAYLHAEGCP